MLKVKSFTASQSSIILTFTFFHGFHNFTKINSWVVFCFSGILLFLKMKDQEPKHLILQTS